MKYTPFKCYMPRNSGECLLSQGSLPCTSITHANCLRNFCLILEDKYSLSVSKLEVITNLILLYVDAIDLLVNSTEADCSLGFQLFESSIHGLVQACDDDDASLADQLLSLSLLSATAVADSWHIKVCLGFLLDKIMSLKSKGSIILIPLVASIINSIATKKDLESQCVSHLVDRGFLDIAFEILKIKTDSVDTATHEAILTIFQKVLHLKDDVILSMPLLSNLKRFIEQNVLFRFLKNKQSPRLSLHVLRCIREIVDRNMVSVESILTNTRFIDGFKISILSPDVTVRREAAVLAKDFCYMHPIESASILIKEGIADRILEAIRKNNFSSKEAKKLHLELLSSLVVLSSSPVFKQKAVHASIAVIGALELLKDDYNDIDFLDLSFVILSKIFATEIHFLDANYVSTLVDTFPKVLDEHAASFERVDNTKAQKTYKAMQNLSMALSNLLNWYRPSVIIQLQLWKIIENAMEYMALDSSFINICRFLLGYSGVTKYCIVDETASCRDFGVRVSWLLVEKISLSIGPSYTDLDPNVLFQIFSFIGDYSKVLLTRVEKGEAAENVAKKLWALYCPFKIQSFVENHSKSNRRLEESLLISIQSFQFNVLCMWNTALHYYRNRVPITEELLVKTFHAYPQPNNIIDMFSGIACSVEMLLLHFDVTQKWLLEPRKFLPVLLLHWKDFVKYKSIMRSIGRLLLILNADTKGNMDLGRLISDLLGASCVEFYQRIESDLHGDPHLKDLLYLLMSMEKDVFVLAKLQQIFFLKVSKDLLLLERESVISQIIAKNDLNSVALSKILFDDALSLHEENERRGFLEYVLQLAGNNADLAQSLLNNGLVGQILDKLLLLPKSQEQVEAMSEELKNMISLMRFLSSLLIKFSEIVLTTEQQAYFILALSENFQSYSTSGHQQVLVELLHLSQILIWKGEDQTMIFQPKENGVLKIVSKNCLMPLIFDYILSKEAKLRSHQSLVAASMNFAGTYILWSHRIVTEATKKKSHSPGLEMVNLDLHKVFENLHLNLFSLGRPPSVLMASFLSLLMVSLQTPRSKDILNQSLEDLSRKHSITNLLNFASSDVKIAKKFAITTLFSVMRNTKRIRCSHLKLLSQLLSDYAGEFNVEDEMDVLECFLVLADIGPKEHIDVAIGCDIHATLLQKCMQIDIKNQDTFHVHISLLLLAPDILRTELLRYPTSEVELFLLSVQSVRSHLLTILSKQQFLYNLKLVEHDRFLFPIGRIIKVSKYVSLLQKLIDFLEIYLQS